MAGLFGLFAGGSDKAARPMYSTESLQILCNRLTTLREDADEQSNMQMVEVIRKITEALVWGEKHDHNLFEFFCEKNILAEFVRVLGLPNVNRTIKVQLLQAISMLVQNISRDTSLYYLFSNNYVNQLISTQFDWADEEIRGYYISFLKSLSMRLNAETIGCFFLERTEQFPLYVEAVRFFAHQDPMVRTAIRALTLKVFRIEDVAMQKFVLERSKRTYFVHLACHLRELWVQLDKATRDAASGGEHSMRALEEAAEQQEDILMFLSDVLEMRNGLGEALAERLLRYAMLPVLLGSLLQGEEGAAGAAPGAGLISHTCALFVLHQVFDTFRSPSLLEPLATALLQSYVAPELLRCCYAAPLPCPATYRATNVDISGPASVEPPPPPPPLEPPPEANASSEGASPGAAALQDVVAAVPGSEGNATPSMMPQGATGVENTMRSRFLVGLNTGPEDACVLLIAGTLSAILARRQVLSQELLVDGGLLPQTLHQRSADEAAAAAQSAASSLSLAIPVPLSAGAHPLEVLLLAIEALGRHVSLRVVVVQVLAQFALELAQEPAAMALPEEWQVAPLEAAKLAVRSAARHVRSYLAGALGDGFLDAFAEEWEQKGGPAVVMREVAGSIRCLLPSSISTLTPGIPECWNMPAPHAERQHAAKAVRCLQVVRRLQMQLENISRAGVAAVENAGDAGGASSASAASAAAGYAGDVSPVPAMPSPPPPLPAAGTEHTEEEWLLRMAEEVGDSYSEGNSFELGRQDRIVCGVVTQEGRHTRYLMLHQYLLLLVQPDLMSPGLAVVRTLCPVRQVEPMIDRSDPRTLRLAIRLAKNAQCPGEAMTYDPTSSDGSFRLPVEEHKGSSFFMLTLSFEDVKRCLCADQHLRRRRQEVRATIQGRVEAFIERLSA